MTELQMLEKFRMYIFSNNVHTSEMLEVWLGFTEGLVSFPRE